MTVALTAVAMLGVFLGLYEWLRRRASRRGDGTKPPVQWGWLAAIVILAALVLVAGLAWS